MRLTSCGDILSVVLFISLTLASPFGLWRSSNPPTHDRTAPAREKLFHSNTGTFAQQRPWTRLRDHIIQLTFGLPRAGHPTCHRDDRPAKSSPLGAGAPTDLLNRYGGDVVLRFNVTTTEEAEALADSINVLLLDVWAFRDDWVDIRLAKDAVPSLLGLLPDSLQHAHTPLMHDLAQSIYESYPSSALLRPLISSPSQQQGFSPALRASTQTADNIFFQDYQPLPVIVPWMRLLASLFPTHVRMFSVGISYEGRDIPALRLGVHPTNSQDPSEPRKTIVISGGSHAREWISVSTVNYLAYSLITSYGKSPTVTRLLERFDWIFIPTLNPDGYLYTWETDRLWRKNRQQTSLRFCRGIDLDRAWGFEWDENASKGNPCSESYPGEYPFEAAESRHFAQWVHNETSTNNTEIVGFLDLHSYSQQVLYPYAYSCQSQPPSLENLEELALGLAKAIRLSNGEHYGVTSACEGTVTMALGGKKMLHPRLETGGGSALDWFYHEMRVRYTYQLKLRDTGSYGFLLPKENIIPTGEEALEAIKYFGKFLLSDFGLTEDEPTMLRPLRKPKVDNEDVDGDEGHPPDDDDDDDTELEFDDDGEEEEEEDDANEEEADNEGAEEEDDFEDAKGLKQKPLKVAGFGKPSGNRVPPADMSWELKRRRRS
ncbi:MAG: putative metallocarboxypeptidase ecm14 [Caeruleum heppii]|nr:MAG: putative metallocarboxypeptidase ecm14 [Caeruleum heppii]